MADIRFYNNIDLDNAQDITNIPGATNPLSTELSNLKSDVSGMKGSVTTSYDSLEKVENKFTNLDNVLASNDSNLDTLQELVDYAKANRTDINNLTSSSPKLAYDADITGTTATITAATHGLGGSRALMVQFYDNNGTMIHGIDVTNASGDITWSSAASVAAGSYIVISN